MFDLAERIKVARQIKDITQQEFSDLLGVCRSTVANYELGRRSPSVEEIVKISEVLDVDVDFLLGVESKKRKGQGVIYVLKNPSFPDYVKIGYADNIETRLQQLNNSECTPFAFRVYATYEVDSRL